MTTQIKDILKSRILVLDGAMGTMIQRHNLSEEQYRGERFKSVAMLQKGNIDLLTLTQPKIIEQIHTEYLEAGADIIQTNTFNTTTISMQDYEMQNYVYEMNYSAAKIARSIADEFTANNNSKPRFVAGSVGPTNKTTSMKPTGGKFSTINFDELQISYEQQIEALVDGGVDIIMIETVFDTLNAKAALCAAQNIFEKREKEIPIIVSATLSDKAGYTYTGETIEGFIASISHINLLSVGFNCSFGASTMKPHLKQLKSVSPFLVIAYPNAGLPNELGVYDETPEIMADIIKEYIDEGLVNIVGGCCGTTPQHIACITKVVDGVAPPTPSKERYKN